jgi:uncharacterized protein YhbP (UPF0306 family)
MNRFELCPADGVMDERIVRFLKKHHVLTLATAADNVPYCANLFYAWLEPERAFVFTSSLDTKHARDASAYSEVAGSVVLETRIVGNVQGVQLRGRMYRPEGELLQRAKKRYLRRFPYAAVMDLELWLLEVSWLKFSDNTLGFGKKLIWEAGESR